MASTPSLCRTLLAMALLTGCADANLFSLEDPEGDDVVADPSVPEGSLLSANSEGSLSDDYDPIPVDTGPDRVVQIDVGNYHVCARISSGSILCWGGNYEGQLGNGTLRGDDVPLPSPVFGVNDSAHLQLGEETTCSLDAAGTATCWGWYVGTGAGADTNVLVPEPIPDLVGIREIIPGRTAHCAVMNTGEILCWGDNFFGQLGDGTEVDNHVPTPVIGISDAIDAAGAEGHFCAVHETGEVSCWGWNGSGQLGNDGSDSSTPVKVPGITTAVAIGVGHSHSCAILESGELTCWGANDSGQLGDGTFDYRSTPAIVPGLADVKKMVGGYVHTCAMLGSGEVYCFGWDGYGNIGDGGDQDNNVWEVSSPSKVVGIDDAVQLGSGALGEFNCVLRASGKVYCWGDGYSGNLGPDVLEMPFSTSFVPVEITGLPLAP